MILLFWASISIIARASSRCFICWCFCGGRGYWSVVGSCSPWGGRGALELFGWFIWIWGCDSEDRHSLSLQRRVLGGSSSIYHILSLWARIKPIFICLRTVIWFGFHRLQLWLFTDLWNNFRVLLIHFPLHWIEEYLRAASYTLCTTIFPWNSPPYSECTWGVLQREENRDRGYQQQLYSLYSLSHTWIARSLEDSLLLP